MVNVEYAIAYSEVLEILKYISLKDYNKIPTEKIQLFENNSSKDYKFNYNPNMTLEEQNVSKRARAIIAILFRDYWATDIQREKILKKQKNDRIKLEEAKKEKYNADELFRNDELNSEMSRMKSSSITEYKEPIYIKIKKWLKQILSKYFK